MHHDNAVYLYNELGGTTVGGVLLLSYDLPRTIHVAPSLPPCGDEQHAKQRKAETDRRIAAAKFFRAIGDAIDKPDRIAAITLDEFKEATTRMHNEGVRWLRGDDRGVVRLLESLDAVANGKDPHVAGHVCGVAASFIRKALNRRGTADEPPAIVARLIPKCRVCGVPMKPHDEQSWECRGDPASGPPHPLEIVSDAKLAEQLKSGAPGTATSSRSRTTACDANGRTASTRKRAGRATARSASRGR